MGAFCPGCCCTAPQEGTEEGAVREQGRAGVGDALAAWKCGECTLQNAASSSRCSACSRPRDRAPVAPMPPADAPGQGVSAPQVLARQAHDEELRRHLLQHSTPHKVSLTVQAAATLLIRARHAQRVVAKRRTEHGCASEVAHLPSPTRAQQAYEDGLRHMSREESIEDGLKLLRQRVAHLKLKVIHMEDDGNCQFRALASELYGDQELHGLVRQKVVEHLRSHSDDFSFFVGDGGEWAAYLQKMGKRRTWGDELTLRAACDCFGCVAHVVTTEHENWLLNYCPSSLDETDVSTGGAPPEGVRELFLTYVSPIHYNVIALPSDPRKASETGY